MWVLFVTGVKKVELEKKKKRGTETDTTHRNKSSKRHLGKMKAKKQLVPARSCPARPRGAARPTGPFCNPPDPEDSRRHRDLSKSLRAALRGAQVPLTQAAPRPERRVTQSSAGQTARAVPGGGERWGRGPFTTH